jgi:hypothetical protein
VTTTIPASANTGVSTTQIGLKVQLASDASGSYVPVVVLDTESEISIGAVSQEGTWVINQGTGGSSPWKVDPSGVTSPVSLASAPLPANAAQEAGGNLAALAATIGAGKLKVDPSGVISPVSLASLPSLAVGSNVIGGVSPAPSSSSNFAITPGSSAGLEASHVLKASAGNLYSLYVLTTSAAGYLMTFNATSAPSNGAVTPVECIPVFASSYAEINFSGAPSDHYSNGIVAVFSTTGPFTLTASATVFFKWRVQ